jgi:hypothetical protein
MSIPIHKMSIPSHKMSIPIHKMRILLYQDKERLASSSAIALTFGGRPRAILRGPEFYEHRKEERCARQFGTTNPGHPYIKVRRRDAPDSSNFKTFFHKALLYFKAQCHEIFDPRVFHQSLPHRAPDSPNSHMVSYSPRKSTIFELQRGHWPRWIRFSGVIDHAEVGLKMHYQNLYQSLVKLVMTCKMVTSLSCCPYGDKLMKI